MFKSMVSARCYLILTSNQFYLIHKNQIQYEQPVQQGIELLLKALKAYAIKELWIIPEFPWCCMRTSEGVSLQSADLKKHVQQQLWHISHTVSEQVVGAYVLPPQKQSTQVFLYVGLTSRMLELQQMLQKELNVPLHVVPLVVLYLDLLKPIQASLILLKTLNYTYVIHKAKSRIIQIRLIASGPLANSPIELFQDFMESQSTPYIVESHLQKTSQYPSLISLLGKCRKPHPDPYRGFSWRFKPQVSIQQRLQQLSLLCLVTSIIAVIGFAYQQGSKRDLLKAEWLAQQKKYPSQSANKNLARYSNHHSYHLYSLTQALPSGILFKQYQSQMNQLEIQAVASSLNALHGWISTLQNIPALKDVELVNQSHRPKDLKYPIHFTLILKVASHDIDGFI